MSAWIEIHIWVKCELMPSVALLVSAWIEIKWTKHRVKSEFVALLVSAWIEIPHNHDPECVDDGRTPRECVD